MMSMKLSLGPLWALVLFGCQTFPADLSAPASTAQEGAVSTGAVGRASLAAPTTLLAPTPEPPSLMPAPKPNEIALAQISAAATVNEQDSIYFAFGTTTIDLAGQQKLRAHAARLKENPDLEVTLIGHTDHLGSRSYNLAVAEQRVRAVGKLLRSYGAKSGQLRYYGDGNEKSDASCKTKACRRQMRRVELIYTP